MIPVALGTYETIVSEWIHSFNQRDLDGMLARVDPELQFHPLRVNGMAHSYIGHDGVRRWFAELLRGKHPQTISLESVTGLADGRVLAAGGVLVDEGAGAPFSGLYEIADSVIVCAYHYFTPPETLVRIGSWGDANSSPSDPAHCGDRLKVPLWTKNGALRRKQRSGEETPLMRL